MRSKIICAALAAATAASLLTGMTASAWDENAEIHTAHVHGYSASMFELVPLDEHIINSDNIFLGKLVSKTVTANNIEWKFEVKENYKGNLTEKYVTAVTGNTDDNFAYSGFETDCEYIIMLEYSGSVYEDRYGLAPAVIPVWDGELDTVINTGTKEDPPVKTASEFRGYIGKVLASAPAKEDDAPRYTKSEDISEIADFANTIVKVKVKGVNNKLEHTNRSIFNCEVIENIKGKTSKTIMPILFKNSVEVGKEYYLFLIKRPEQTLYLLAAKKGVYSADDIVITSYSEKDGLKYKYKKSSPAKKYYKNGVLLKNRWIRINGKRFYLGDEGAKQTGWVSVKNEWYYIDSENGMLTGEQTIDGKFYDLGESGKWDGVYRRLDGSAVNSAALAEILASGLEDHKDDFGGYYYDEGMFVINSLGEKTEKLLDGIAPGISGIILKECRYSLAELEKIQNEITDDPALKGKWYECGIGMGGLELGVNEKYFDEVKQYIEDKGYSDAVNVVIGTEIVLE